MPSIRSRTTAAGPQDGAAGPTNGAPRGRGGVEISRLGPVTGAGPGWAGASALEEPLAAEIPAPVVDQEGAGPAQVVRVVGGADPGRGVVDGGVEDRPEDDAAWDNRWPDRIVGEDRVDPRTLVPNPRNWRTHPEGQARVLSGVMSEIGIVQRVIVNRRTGRLVDGHLRVKLAIQSGVRRLPVAYVDLSEEEERVVLATFDPIAGLADADARVLTDLIAQTEAQDPAIRDLLETMRRAADPTYDPDDHDVPGGAENEDGGAVAERDVPDAEPDRAEELRAKWRTDHGQLWLISSVTVPGRTHRLIVGDCTDRKVVARLFMAEGLLATPHDTQQRALVKADCVWTDPPYGVDYVGKTGDALTIRGDGLRDLLDLLTAFMRQTEEVAREGAPYYVCHGDKNADVLRQALAACGWAFRQNLIWVKHHFVMGGSDYHPMHEPVAYGFLPGPAIGRLAATDSSKRGVRNWHGPDNATTVLPVDRPSASETHPTTKPVPLVAAMLRNSTGVGSLVYDPFAGSGATLAAAESLGRVSYACEIDPKYAAVTLERMQRAGCDVRCWNG